VGRKSEASDAEAHAHERPTAGPHVDGRFRQPTDVAWDSAGNAFISDGYINARVAKVSKDGDWLKSWGKKGKADGEFDTLHSIASDSNNNIYVADRNNRRVQVFDNEALQVQVLDRHPPPPDAKPAIGTCRT